MISKGKIYSDLQRVWGDYGSLLLGNIGTMALGLFSTTLLTRHLGLREFGIFSLFLFISQGVRTIFFDWSDVVIMRFCREELDRLGNVSKIFWIKILKIVFLFIPICVALFVFRHSIKNYTELSEWGILLLVGHIILSVLFGLSQNILKAVREIRISSLFSFCDKLIYMGLLFIVIQIKLVDLHVFILLMLCSTFVVAIFSILHLQRKVSIEYDIDINYTKKILIYSYPFFFSYIFSFIGTWGDLAVINHFLTKSDVGLYSVPLQISNIFGSLVILANTVLTPLLTSIYVSGREDIIRKFVQDLMPIGLFLWTVIVGITFLPLEILIPEIFGKTFTPALHPLYILLIGVAVSGIQVLFAVMMVYVKSWSSSIAIIGYGAINFLGDILVVPRFGIQGAAIAKCISTIALSLFLLEINVRSLKIRRTPFILSLSPIIFFGIIAFQSCPKTTAIIEICIVILFYIFFLRRVKILTPDTIESLHLLYGNRHFRKLSLLFEKNN